MCTKSGDQIEKEAGDVLLRNVSPSCLAEEGEPSSQAFLPRGCDEGCLSVDRGTKTTAEESFALLTAAPPEGFGYGSVGVWGLTLAEVHGQALTVWEDALKATAEKPANPAHAVIDFGGLGDKKRRNIARALKVHALKRRRLHPPEEAAA
jgi:hypothetical protein